jgi:putative cardiolipin synthase
MSDLHFGVGKVIHDRMEEGEIVKGMVDPIGEVLRSADEEIKIANAYIIPNDPFIEGLGRITGRGIEVGILTNSLSSHDTPAVNSHYKKWRKPLIEAGAALYELRSDPAIRAQIQTTPVEMKYAGLHSKTVVVDGERVFIGSFNFDPRSVDINTEMGVIIDSPGLGREMVEIFERDTLPENAWQVLLDEEGELYWTNSDETVTRQPARGWWQRVQDAFFVILPESQF